jgi:hypothetical protein
MKRFVFAVLICLPLFSWAQSGMPYRSPLRATYNRAKAVFATLWEKPLLGWILWLACALIYAFLYWQWRWHRNPPSSGAVVAWFGLVAAFMALLPKIGGLQKSLWLVVLILFLRMELNSIKQEQVDTERQHRQDRSEDSMRFGQVLQSNREATAQILQSQQDKFETTMNGFEQSQREAQSQFAALVGKQEELYKHEEQLARSLSGHLIPAGDKTPYNGCLTGQVGQTDLPASDRDTVVVFAAGQSFFVRDFPNIVLQIGGANIIILERAADKSISVTMDLRSADETVIARLNRDGWVVNRNKILAVLTPDASTLIIVDDFGLEVLNIHYLNTQAIRISGKVNYKGHDYYLGDSLRADRFFAAGNCIVKWPNEPDIVAY